MAKSIRRDIARDQRGVAKPPKSPIPCRGIRTSTTEGVDYDCDYEQAGEVDCGQCIVNGGALDPRTGEKYTDKVDEARELQLKVDSLKREIEQLKQQLNAKPKTGWGSH